MAKRLRYPLAFLLALGLLLAGCGGGDPAPAAAPSYNDTSSVDPVTPDEPTTPADEPVSPDEGPSLDISARLLDFWASVPADEGYGAVGAAELSEEATGMPFLVDLRETGEIEKDGYIPGAINIPIRSLLDNLDKLPAEEEPIVVYCGSGHRGGFALMALKMLGYGDVRNLGGGMGAWLKAGLPVVSGSLPQAPAAISAPVIADPALFEVLKDYLASLPEGFASVKADALSAELAAAQPPLLVDVRSQAEWDNDGYIEEAVHIPFPDFLNDLDQLPADERAAIVVACASGHRGAMAEMALALMGYTDARNLNGGVGAWQSAGLPLSGQVDWAAVLGEFVSTLPKAGFYSVSAGELHTMLTEKAAFLLDVREVAEVQKGYIAGAVNIPIRDLLKNLDKLPAQNQKIVTYCSCGHRGALAMSTLRLLGYTDVFNLGGGSVAWTKSGLPLKSGLPEAPAAGMAPAVNPIRLADLDAYLSALPVGFNIIVAAELNAELGGAMPPFVLDVRTEAEIMADGWIAGSLWIPINDLPAGISKLPVDKTSPVVVTCKSGHRGSMAMLYLNFLGYTNVRNLGMGMNAWITAELPVIKSSR